MRNRTVAPALAGSFGLGYLAGVLGTRGMLRNELTREQFRTLTAWLNTTREGQ